MITVPFDSGIDQGAAVDAAVASRPSVFIVSPVRLHREGLACSLTLRKDLNVLGSAAPTEMTAAWLSDLQTSAVLMDMTAANALDLAKTLRRSLPQVKIVAFAVIDSDQELLAYAAAGVAGYVTQDGSLDDLVAAITRALKGELFCSPRLASLLFQRVAVLSDTRGAPEEPPGLTRRERQVVNLLSQGLSNKEIAGNLRIGSATVKNHVHSILEKLHVRRRGEAAARWHAVPAATTHRDFDALL
jgi:two-component system nitrate/nitrite response regulator NarL